jgi:hypothetical protein
VPYQVTTRLMSDSELSRLVVAVADVGTVFVDQPSIMWSRSRRVTTAGGVFSALLALGDGEEGIHVGTKVTGRCRLPPCAWAHLQSLVPEYILPTGDRRCRRRMEERMVALGFRCDERRTGASVGQLDETRSRQHAKTAS